jgi:hypothetical protein
VIVLRVLIFSVGLWIVAGTFASSVRTVILPRGVPARIGRFVFRATRRLFDLRIGRRAGYERRDRILAAYAPVALLLLLATWMILIFAGFTLMFWARNWDSIYEAFNLSGSSLFTLGFQRPGNEVDTALVLGEAILGLGELAMLISYLPTIYVAFSRREQLVAMLEVRAGSPPSGVEMLERFFILGRLEALTDEVWVRWETWFVDVEESHTSIPALNFFRSPQPDHSWVTAAGAVLDAASIMASSVDLERQVQAEICIRAGYLALRRISDYFGIPYDPDPRPDDPISVTREEFEAARDRLAAAGVPLKPDRDQAWRDFAGWRVNYDRVLLALATLTSAPYAPWSSDRGLTGMRAGLFRRQIRIRP